MLDRTPPRCFDFVISTVPNSGGRGGLTSNEKETFRYSSSLLSCEGRFGLKSLSSKLVSKFAMSDDGTYSSFTGKQLDGQRADTTLQGVREKLIHSQSSDLLEDYINCKET